MQNKQFCSCFLSVTPKYIKNLKGLHFVKNIIINQGKFDITIIIFVGNNLMLLCWCNSLLIVHLLAFPPVWTKTAKLSSENDASSDTV